jgi:hypothetical protein
MLPFLEPLTKLSAAILARRAQTKAAQRRLASLVSGAYGIIHPHGADHMSVTRKCNPVENRGFIQWLTPVGGGMIQP